MTSPRWLSFFLIALTALPLAAEQSTSSTPPHSIAEGTTFLIRLEDKLDTARVQPGKRFKARLSENLLGSNLSRLLRDSRIKGHVSSVGNGLRPRLLLSFDEIETEHGWVPLMATITAVPGEHGLEVSGDEGEIAREGSSSRRHDGGSSEDGPKGDGGLGAEIGSAVGAVKSLFGDRRLELQKGTTLEVRLDRPIAVPWR
jgi:hypothetical protein